MVNMKELLRCGGSSNKNNKNKNKNSNRQRKVVNLYLGGYPYFLVSS